MTEKTQTVKMQWCHTRGGTSIVTDNKKDRPFDQTVTGLGNAPSEQDCMRCEETFAAEAWDKRAGHVTTGSTIHTSREKTCLEMGADCPSVFPKRIRS
jgi:hypothetical protein